KEEREKNKIKCSNNTEENKTLTKSEIATDCSIFATKYITNSGVTNLVRRKIKKTSVANYRFWCSAVPLVVFVIDSNWR
ncbi:hypothetical protein GIB67_039957, partial [Kingdonia uniflora]